MAEGGEGILKKGKKNEEENRWKNKYENEARLRWIIRKGDFNRGRES